VTRQFSVRVIPVLHLIFLLM